MERSVKLAEDKMADDCQVLERNTASLLRISKILTIFALVDIALIKTKLQGRKSLAFCCFQNKSR